MTPYTRVPKEASIESKIDAMDPKDRKAMYQAWVAFEQEEPQREAAQRRIDDDMLRRLREVRAELEQLEAGGDDAGARIVHAPRHLKKPPPKE